MDKKQGKRTNLKNLFHWINSVLGTFLFVFFIMATIIMFVTDLKNANWIMPLFVVVSCMGCITFGMDYWVREDSVRRWSYCISHLIVIILLVPISLGYMICFGTSRMLLRFIAAVLLPTLSFLYGILKARKKKMMKQTIDPVAQTASLKGARTMLRKMIRVVCLLCICCVMLESWYKMILVFYYYVVEPSNMIYFPELVTVMLSILSAILLARFIKAEFVQRDVPKPEAIKQRRTERGALD